MQICTALKDVMKTTLHEHPESLKAVASKVANGEEFTLYQRLKRDFPTGFMKRSPDALPTAYR